jgi:predicted RNA-binding Zn-ribbon protein involved in translation (DUF1610 family)
MNRPAPHEGKARRTPTYGCARREGRSYVQHSLVTGQDSGEYALMHASEVTAEVARRANELYWDSGGSVNKIAEDLDLSKGALYGILEPQPVGLGCPLCGDEVGWANRTAKDKESLTCPTCDWDGSPDEAGAVADTPAPVRTEDDDEDSPHMPAPLPPPPVTVASPRMSTIASGALIGAAVGLALVLWARRR